MVNALFEFGREGFLSGDLDWDLQNFKAALLDLNTAEVGVRQITSSTVATPIVVTTAVAHGYTNGDIVYIAEHINNLPANGLWVIAAASGSVFSLLRYTDGTTNSVGAGSAGSGGYAVNLGRGTVGTRFWDAFDGCQVTNGLSGNLASKTVTAGVADAADVLFTAVTGNTVEAVAIFQDTGTPATARMAALVTGKFLGIVAADAASSATTIWLDKPLPANVSSQTVAFSNGVSATTVTGTSGNRFVTCTALPGAIAAGNHGLISLAASGLPVTPNGGNITVAWQETPVPNIFKL